MASDVPPEGPIPPLSATSWELLPDGPISLSLTKRDVRELYFALLDICDSQTFLQQALIHYSNANLGFAQDNLVRSQRTAADAQQRVHSIMASIMASARSKR